MRAFLVVDLGEVVLDEENKFPWAINWFRRSDSAVGKFFIVLFLGWLMIIEAILLGILFAITFVFGCILCCVPILNICILVDAIRDGDVLSIIGSILGLILYSIIGLLSFFMQDVRPIYWITDKLVMLLGGSYLPVALFPRIMKIFAYISPFGAINFTSSTVYSSWNNEFIIRILLQIIWIIVFGLILIYVYKKAMLLFCNIAILPYFFVFDKGVCINLKFNFGILFW